MSLVPVVLTHSLDKQELAFGRRFIGNAVGDAWQDLMSFADGKLVAMVGTTGLDGEFAPQHEIMVRALAVIMPGNDVAISQREDTDLDIRADGVAGPNFLEHGGCRSSASLLGREGQSLRFSEPSSSVFR
jgi:hypothetical protein